MALEQSKTPNFWRQIQRDNFTCVSKLATFLELSLPLQQELLLTPKFILNLPQRLAQKISKNTLQDPILRQYVPLQNELERSPGFVADPVCDKTFQKGRRILHKYKGRALWLTSSACAMHCRYCFRQNFPYETTSQEFSTEIAYLQENTDIQEIILSGGDPLSLSNEALHDLLRTFDSIPHIKRIRFHTKFPIGIPERIDDGFLEILRGVKSQIVFIIHCNHPRELDADVVSALQKIGKLGIPLLNQSVLLKGVNSDEETLLLLCETLVDAGIIPYYLHLLDPVLGAQHFETSEERGKELIRYVQLRLSGYGVPRLVREEAGCPSKTFII
jgi:EF-P beta-lysylation protein EpmB